MTARRSTSGRPQSANGPVEAGRGDGRDVLLELAAEIGRGFERQLGGQVVDGQHGGADALEAYQRLVLERIEDINRVLGVGRLDRGLDRAVDVAGDIPDNTEPRPGAAAVEPLQEGLGDVLGEFWGPSRSR